MIHFFEAFNFIPLSSRDYHCLVNNQRKSHVTQHCQQQVEAAHTLVLVDADECEAIARLCFIKADMGVGACTEPRITFGNTSIISYATRYGYS